MSFGYLSLQLSRTPGVRIISDGQNGMHFKVDFTTLTSPDPSLVDPKNKVEHHWSIRHLSATEDKLVRYTANHNAPSTIHESYQIPWGEWRQVLTRIREAH